MKIQTDMPTGALNSGVKNIVRNFSQLQETWNDDLSKKFEEDYIAPLPDLFKRPLSAMDELSGLFRKIQKELGES